MTDACLLPAALVKHIFPSDDRVACMVDNGWIVGHAYPMHGPLAKERNIDNVRVDASVCDVRTLLADGRQTQAHIVPLRTGRDPPPTLPRRALTRHDLSSLRVLGSVDELIDPETWTGTMATSGAASARPSTHSRGPYRSRLARRRLHSSGFSWSSWTHRQGSSSRRTVSMAWSCSRRHDRRSRERCTTT